MNPSIRQEEMRLRSWQAAEPGRTPTPCSRVTFKEHCPTAGELGAQASGLSGRPRLKLAALSHLESLTVEDLWMF